MLHKPLISTRSPFARALDISSKNSSTTASALLLESPVSVLRVSMRSALFTMALPRMDIKLVHMLVILNWKVVSLISKPTLLTAVRACPINGVAGHAPQIFHHALLAYLKTAATGPAKGSFFAAQMAEIFFFASPFGSWPAVY